MTLESVDARRAFFATVIDPYYHHNDGTEHEQNYKDSGHNFLRPWDKLLVMQL